MKAITIWQPWASLIACGAKKFETRSWKTDYRGPIAIHAGAKPYLSVVEGLPEEFQKALKDIFDLRYEILHIGKILATAELVDCHNIYKEKNKGAFISKEDGWLWISEKEQLFGDWQEGRYAWELANVKMLPKPVPAKGHQRLWEWEDKRC